MTAASMAHPLCESPRKYDHLFGSTHPLVVGEGRRAAHFCTFICQKWLSQQSLVMYAQSVSGIAIRQQRAVKWKPTTVDTHRHKLITERLKVSVSYSVSRQCRLAIYGDRERPPFLLTTHLHTFCLAPSDNLLLSFSVNSLSAIISFSSFSSPSPFPLCHSQQIN